MALIFISYRTKDDALAARIVTDRISDYFGQARVFRDTTSIELGDEFPSTIWQHLREARVLLAVIGPQWLTAQNAHGVGIEDPEDWVRREIAEAIKTKKKIIPILSIMQLCLAKKISHWICSLSSTASLCRSAIRAWMMTSNA